MVSLNVLVLCASVTAVGETVLLEFTSDNCVHCRNMEPTMRRLKDEGYPVRKINISKDPRWAEQYRVRSVPAFRMIAGGKVVDHVDGFTSHTRIVRMFQQANYTPAGVGNEQIRAQSPESSSGSFGLSNLLAKRDRPTNAAQPPPIGPPPPTSPAALQPTSESAPAKNPPLPSYENGSRSSGLTSEQQAMSATVRVKVEDPKGYSFGTGTIIDTHGDEALVITCGHIFRDSDGKGRITVDLFVRGMPQTVPGQLITYDASASDIGLVTIRPGVDVSPIRVAPTGYKPRPGTRVFSIGCNNGRPPSLKRSQISSVDRYMGPPNIEVAGMPVNGRSGGGLFTEDGLLIGICNAADEQDDEGIFAAIGVIHQTLTEIGQSRIFASETDNAIAAAPATEQPIDVGGAVEELEIICIVRSRSNPNADAQTIFLDRPSAQFVDQLKAESQNRSASPSPARADGEPAGMGLRNNVADARGDRMPDGIRGANPVLRAQSRR